MVADHLADGVAAVGAPGCGRRVEGDVAWEPVDVVRLVALVPFGVVDGRAEVFEEVGEHPERAGGGAPVDFFGGFEGQDAGQLHLGAVDNALGLYVAADRSGYLTGFGVAARIREAARSAQRMIPALMGSTPALSKRW
jgi:hypothetical protein